MGRKIPIGENPSLIHPMLSLSLFVAGITATVAIISSLCGSLSRKKSSSPSASQHITTENPNLVISPPNEAKTTTHTTMKPPTAAIVGLEDTTDHHTTSPQNEEEEEEEAPLPPPPGVLRGAASYHYRSNSTASVGQKLSLSMSMRVAGGGGREALRQLSRREERHDKKREKKLDHEDSIWKKRIILGEKCRVPDEDEAILYDEKGNRISTFHPRTPSSLPMSRQTSFIDPDAIPN